MITSCPRMSLPILAMKSPIIMLMFIFGLSCIMIKHSVVKVVHPVFCIIVRRGVPLYYVHVKPLVLCMGRGFHDPWSILILMLRLNILITVATCAVFPVSCGAERCGGSGGDCGLRSDGFQLTLGFTARRHTPPAKDPSPGPRCLLLFCLEFWRVFHSVGYLALRPTLLLFQSVLGSSLAELSVTFVLWFNYDFSRILKEDILTTRDYTRWTTTTLRMGWVACTVYRDIRRRWLHDYVRGIVHGHQIVPS